MRPSPGATIVCSIFIASSTSSGAPRPTRSPAAISWRTILPGIGAVSTSPCLVLRRGDRQRVDPLHLEAAERREQVQLVAERHHARAPARAVELDLEPAVVGELGGAAQLAPADTQAPAGAIGLRRRSRPARPPARRRKV